MNRERWAEEIIADPKTAEFFAGALESGAHRPIPKGAWENKWPRDLMITARYYRTSITQEGLAKRYGLDQMSINRILRETPVRIWSNYTGRPTEEYPIDKLPLKRSADPLRRVARPLIERTGIFIYKQWRADLEQAENEEEIQVALAKTTVSFWMMDRASGDGVLAPLKDFDLGFHCGPTKKYESLRRAGVPVMRLERVMLSGKSVGKTMRVYFTARQLRESAMRVLQTDQSLRPIKRDTATARNHQLEAALTQAVDSREIGSLLRQVSLSFYNSHSQGSEPLLLSLRDLVSESGLHISRKDIKKLTNFLRGTGVPVGRVIQRVEITPKGPVEAGIYFIARQSREEATKILIDD